MKLNLNILINISVLLLFNACSTTTTFPVGKIGKITHTTKNDKSIEEDQVGILIELFDFQTKEKVSISDVQNLPGTVRDSTVNSKLLLFTRDNIPERINIKKPGKGAVFISPSFNKNNLLIYKLYLFSAEKGIM